MPKILSNTLRAKDENGQWVDIPVVIKDDVQPNQEQIQIAVNAWLDEHPEATTTVEDESLTYKKLIPGTLGYVTPQMFGAKGDGIADDTAAIQAAFDASHFIYFPDGIYMISAENSGWGHLQEGGVIPQSNTKIVISKNATLKAITSNTAFYNVLNISNVENVTVSGGNIQGEKNTHSGSTGEHGYGINISESKNILIEDVNVFDCWGDSIVVNTKNETTGTVENVIIRNCVLHDSRRQGISVVMGKYITIDNCEIYNIEGTAPQAGIDIESNGVTGIYDVLISHCYIHDTVGASIILANSFTKNVIVSDCVLGRINHIGEKLEVCNSKMNSIRLAGDSVLVMNCEINDYVDIEGGNGFFTNCKMKSKSGEDSRLIFVGSDNYQTKTTEFVSFENCDMDASESTRLIQLTNSSPFPEKRLSFNNCNIKTKSFSNRLPKDGIDIIDCFIDIVNSIYQVFTLSTGSNPMVVHLSNNIFKFDSRPSYLFSSSAAHDITLFMNNNVIEYTTLFYSNNASAKTLMLLFDNVIKATNPSSVVGGGSSTLVRQYHNNIVNGALQS